MGDNRLHVIAPLNKSVLGKTQPKFDQAHPRARGEELQNANQVEQAAVLSPEEPDKAAFIEQPKAEEAHRASAAGAHDDAVKDLSDEDRSNFRLTDYTDVHGRKQRMWDVSEEGLPFIMGRMKGEGPARMMIRLGREISRLKKMERSGGFGVGSFDRLADCTQYSPFRCRWRAAGPKSSMKIGAPLIAPGT